MMISVTEMDSVATQSRLHSEQGCAKDAHLFSANQAPHIKLCITTEEQNIECSRSCNISQSFIMCRVRRTCFCSRNEEKGGIENGSHISYFNSIPHLTDLLPFFLLVTIFLKISHFEKST